jgi:hypothetical protein
MDTLDIEDLDLSKGDYGSSSGTGIEYLMNPKHKPTTSQQLVTRSASRSDFDRDLTNTYSTSVGGDTNTNTNANTNANTNTNANANANTNANGGFFSSMTDLFGGFGADSLPPVAAPSVVPSSAIAPSEWDREQIRQSAPPAATYGSSSHERTTKKKKRQMLRDLKRFEEMDPSRFKVTVTEDSAMDEIEDEFDIFNEEYDQQTGLDMIRQTFTGSIAAVESINTYVNPFDWNLEGMGDAVTENVSTFEHLFIKLQRQYKNIDIPVPLQIGFQLFVIGASVHVSNQAMKQMANMGGLSQSVLNNPEVKNAVRNASVSTVQSYLNTGPPPPAAIHTTNRPPAAAAAPSVPVFSSRPDLDAALERQPQAQAQTQVPAYKPMPIAMDINAINPHVQTNPALLLSQEKGVSLNAPMQFTSSRGEVPRQEMRGPGNLTNNNVQSTDVLLANLKAKMAAPAPPTQKTTDWSIESVNSLMDDVMPPTNGKPRRKKSDRQSIMTVDL